MLIRLLPLLALLTGCAADLDGDGLRGTRDCDETDRAVNADAVEVCDGIDNNCDGFVDEGVSILAYWDQDGDGFGDPSLVRRVCELPADGSVDGTDCNDADDRAFPGAEERCNLQDDDCDGTVDEDALLPFYRDDDGDGRGTTEVIAQACEPPEGAAPTPDDCDDTDPLAWTDRPEVCDGADNNCNGAADEDLPLQPVWADADGDGGGDPLVQLLACGEVDGVADAPDDCDDSNAAVGPDAIEQPGDGIDNDCDGLVDEIRVPGDHATLQQALAANEDGSVIQLGQGTFFGSINLTGRDITLMGAGCGQTIVYADGNGSALTMTAGTVGGLTLAGGAGEYGGGLRIDGDVVAQDLCVQGNTVTERGGGIALLGGSLTLSDSVVSRNIASDRGGGLFMANSTELTLRRVQFLDNSANTGGNMAVAAATVDADAVVLAGGTASQDGGGLYMLANRIDNGDAVFRHTTVYGNVGSRTSSAIFARDADLTLEDSIVAGHTGTRPAMYIDGGDPVFLRTAMANEGRDIDEGYIVHALRGLPVWLNVAGAPSTWDLRQPAHSDFAHLGAWTGDNALADDVGDPALDSDSDGQPDGWELLYGLRRYEADADDDADSDGLTGAEEAAALTHPFIADTDDDGVVDGQDIDPNNPADQAPFPVLSGMDLSLLTAPVRIDASASFDPNGDPVTATWTVTPPPGGSQVDVTSDATTAEFIPDAAGTWDIELTLDDGRVQRTDTHSVRVIDAVVVPDDAPDMATAAAQGATAIALRSGTWQGADLSSDTIVFGLGEPADTRIVRDAGTVLWAEGELTLAQLTVAEGLAEDDAGCLFVAGAVHLTDVHFMDCEAGLRGGAVFAESDLTARDVVVHGTRAREGAVFVQGTVDWQRGRFSNNLSSVSAAGLHIETSATSPRHTVNNTVFSHNTSRDASAIYHRGTTSLLTVSHSAFLNNTGRDANILSLTGSTVVVDSVLVGQSGPILGEGFTAQTHMLYSHLWNNDSIGVGGAEENDAASGLGSGNPLLARWTDDADPWDDVPVGRIDSPLTAAALPGGLNLDGSAADLGPGGGPFADRQHRAFYADSDDDGLPDAWQQLSTPRVTADADADADGLNGAQELFHGSAPDRADTDADGATDGAEVAEGTEALLPQDNRPVAVVADTVQVDRGTPATLDGTGSSDPNGDPLTYEWTVTRAPDGSTLQDQRLDSVADPTIVPDARGTFEVTLVVQAGGAASLPVVQRVVAAGDLLVPSEYATVKEALVDVRLGDTIRLAPGVHEVRITQAPTRFTLAGSGVDETTIVPGTADRLLDLQTGDSVSFEDLTVQDGLGLIGGAVTCDSATFSAERVRFTRNGSGQGGALRMQDCTTTLESVDITHNESTGAGGGVYVSRGSLVWIQGSLSENRAAANGGGLYVTQGTVILQNVVADANRSPSPGGAVYAAGAVLNGSFLTVTRNQSNRGAFFTTSTEGRITHSLFSENDGFGILRASGEALTAEYNGYFDNASGGASPSALIDVNSQTADPRFVSDTDRHLRADSPYIDAGDPTLRDPDGTVADLGAFGGDRAESTFNEWYVDTDMDGLPDGWERDNGLDPASPDADSDNDSDGADALSEYLNGTDATDPDSDNDGVPDGIDTAPLDGSGVPVPHAGDDLIIDANELTVLDGRASTGTIDGWQWAVVDGPSGADTTLSASTSAQPTFASADAGRFVLALTVRNGDAVSGVDTVTVDVRGTLHVPRVYADAQQALDDALDGGSVDIAAGTWPVHVQLDGRSLSVTGAGRDQTRLVGDDGAVFEAVGGVTLTLTDLTVADGSSAEGGNIRMVGDSDATATLNLTRVGVEDGLAVDGGGVALVQAALNADDCAFVGNQATRFGGGLYLERVEASVVNTSVFADNHAVVFDGGGAFIQGGQLDTFGTRWVDNTATAGGALMVQEPIGDTPTHVTLDYVTAVGNSRVVGGSFLSLVSGQVDVSNSIVAFNDGTAFAANEGTVVSLNDTSFAGDNAWDLGVEDPTGADGNRTEDPLFTAFSNNADWTDDDLTLQAGSPSNGRGAYAAP